MGGGLSFSENIPLVSVGIPTYNRPEGLRRTLECITGQTYKNLEIIVSDNCSPGPETEAVVREFMERDSRIQYYRQKENKGPTRNFVFVLEKASGVNFIWAADDDEWKDTYIEECYKPFIENQNVVLTYSEAIIHNYCGFKDFLWVSDMETVGLSKINGIKKVLNNQHRNTEFYGLMITDIIKKYKHIGFFGEDHVIVFYLSLIGEIKKIKPGLFISGIGDTSSSIANIVNVLNLKHYNIYFGYIIQMLWMMKTTFIYGHHLSFFTKMRVIKLIIQRYLYKSKYRDELVLGIRALIKDIL